MNSPRVVVFTGPSFSHAAASKIVPFAELRVPVRRHDLEEFREPDLVAIIDGVFDSELAVSPREIRDAIGRGVRVVGAASMGALRAVEVPEMLGVGRIFEMYRRGDLQRDDEVAVLLDSDSGRALTEPLVNIRFAVERLVDAGSINKTLGQTVIDAASGLHFHDRVYRNILRAAGLDRLSDADALTHALRSFDLKSEDARTLLESLVDLGASPHWSSLARRSAEAPDLPVACGRDVAVSARAAADAPVAIWETGDQVSFSDLVAFLAATGQLDAFGRRALLRFLLGGGEVGVSEEADVPTVQEMFEDVAVSWGWRSHEEIHVTLRDLGFGESDLGDQLRDERASRRTLRGIYRDLPEAFRGALRFELLWSDLALKREVMRLGALRGLAGLAVASECTPLEIEDAKRAILCARPEIAWEAVAVEAGATDEGVAAIVELIARARRTGTGVLRQIEGAASEAGIEAAGLRALDSGHYAADGRHSLPEADAAAAARDIAARIGITRIAQIGELERFGLHVTSAYRASRWSSTVGSGKSQTLDGAIVGSVMEEVEKYCQEAFGGDIACEARFDDLKGEAIDASQFDLPYDTRHTPSSTIGWTRVSDLLSDSTILAPTSLFSYERQPNDPLYSPRRGSRIFSTSGLAAGFSLSEAILHALCEVIERHALKLSEQAVSNPGGLPESRWPEHKFVDLQTCPPSTQLIVEAIRGAGYEVRALDITSDVSVPTFAARVMLPRSIHGVEVAWPGSCTHPSSEEALNRALLECVQSRVTFLSGAREDFALNARSLGRHERPRPGSNGDAFWFRPYVPKKPFDAIGGVVAGSAREALGFVARRTAAAGFSRILYKEMTRDEVAPARAVRVVVPDMETSNPFYTGIRARALLVADLLRRHAW